MSKDDLVNGSNYYVYEHWRPDRDECFYVGKGRGNRANVLYGRNTHHTAIQLKLSRLGLCVEIRLVATELTESMAFELERERIAFWRANGNDLANFTDGGEGGSNPRPETRELMRKAKLGRKLSDEHKAKIGEASRRVAQDPEYRAKLGEAISAACARPEVKAKRSASQKKRVRTKEHYEKVSAALTGRKLSPEHAEKARNASKGRKQSLDEIERRRVANTGKKRTDAFKEQMRAIQTPEIRAASRQRMSIPVVCLTNGITYSSAKLAAETLGLDNSMITKVCRGKFTHTKGYSFSYASEMKVK
ncbi:MAG: GIY-YIG nuclease family protein [Patescibacteria group bacterium]|nr:GIY-YIG nuclease family protein [Patescibacteria group bacterium]